MTARREISSEEFAALEPDLTAGPQGDGRDADGRMFSITRYTSRKTGRLYDRVFSSGSGEQFFDVTPNDRETGEGG